MNIYIYIYLNIINTYISNNIYTAFIPGKI